MSKRPAEKISKRMVDALSAHGRPGVYWDRDLPGFGVRLYPTGRTTYVVQSRGPTGSRRVTVGQHGAISAEQARKAAAAIIDRIKAGEDPIPEVAEPGREPTVADLAERYLRTHVAVQCKASSMRRYRQLPHHHILPALGEMPPAMSRPLCIAGRSACILRRNNTMIRLSPISRPSDLPVLNPLAELKPEPASPPGGPAELPLARGRERSAGSGEPGRSMPRLSASRTTGPIARSGHRAACAACAALLLVAVLGTALPAAAQSVVTFVSNAGQGRLDQYDTNFSRAQAFTTGSNASGYTLSSAEFVSSDAQGDDAAVSLCTVNNSNHPTSSCTALSPPQSFTSGTLVFTAPANTPLEADTTYTLLMTSPGGQSLKQNGTNSDGEDSGGTAGWSIANESHFYNAGWSSRTQPFYITIKGTAKTQGNATGAPGITGTAHVGETLTATPGTIADPDGLHTTWFSNAATTVQWIRVDGGSDSEISSATDRTYTLVAADEGKQVKVKVDFTDDDVNDESRTSDAYPAGSTVLPADSVPSDWSLIPTGLSTGDTFRLLFLSSTKRNASSTDIADYNTFVQNLAAAGHTDIRTYSAGFRVVGCTAAVDARDNTKTTYTTTDKGVPVYWLNGAKAADQYEDFYDGSWDDEANEKNESGADGLDTSQNGNRPFTGCKHDGTEAVNSFDDSRGLGANPVRVAVPNSSGSGHGPISSNSISEGNANTRPMYGLSAVFQVAADTTPPTLTSAGVNEAGLFILLGFSENLQLSNLPPASAFTVTAGGSAFTVGGVLPRPGAPDVFVITVSPAIRQGQAIVVTYTDPTAGDDATAFQDTAGNDAASFTTGMNGVPAITNASTVVPATTATEVPADWSLKPTAVTAGTQFRLLFLSSTKRNASSTDIADYNTFIQGRAAAGHTDIQTYSTGFRVVGCTADTDARDNTSTTYTATDKGVPIYWLNGAKAADEYEDFYDGDWDDEVNDKNESGTNSHDTSQQVNYPFTGCAHDGTEAKSGSGLTSYALGNSARVGRPNSSSQPSHGPLSSASSSRRIGRHPPPVRALGGLPGGRRRGRPQQPAGVLRRHRGPQRGREHGRGPERRRRPDRHRRRQRHADLHAGGHRRGLLRHRLRLGTDPHQDGRDLQPRSQVHL